MLLRVVVFFGVVAVVVASAEELPAAIAGASSEETAVTVGARTVVMRVLSPADGRIDADPAVVITFATDRVTSLTRRPYSLTAEHFLENGHRAVSIDLPMHGERVGEYGSQIEGFRNAFVAGVDPFAMLVEDGKAVIDALVRSGVAKPGRIVVAGTSRGGYMALRLFAADKRIAACAGYAPVTDWRVLREFAADKERSDVADVALKKFVAEMAGRPMYVAIGKTDERVGTRECEEFIEALRTSAANDAKTSPVQFQLTDDAGHSLNEQFYEAGRQFLLQQVVRTK